VAEFEDVLDGGRAGRLVPPGDVAALAAAMYDLAADGEMRRRLGAAALERSARYAVSEMVQGNIRVYDELRRS
jgi:glycosyltransferase involved in cell wall biosynthesis